MLRKNVAWITLGCVRFYLGRMSAYVILLQVLHLKMFELLLINV